ncbi:hypothetical protein [Nostoc sp.]|uniref:hypothetical protein n=1 Tax=Nostoc sp. TaxID=1180 RepID=UPI002FF9CEDA
MIEMAENAKNHPPDFTNAAFDVVAIAASPGGLTAEALVQTTGVEIQGFLAKPFTAKQLLNFVQTIFR